MPDKKNLGDAEARAEILEIGRRMYARGYVAANDGNISCRLGPDLILATPTGVSKGFMKAGQLVVLRLDGTVVQAGDLPPSSEIKMHLRVYNENPEVWGVTHAHPPVATAFAVAGLALDASVYPEALVNLGVVPCVHYEAPGSPGVADSVAPYCRDYNALLLANHGALSWGQSLMEAYFRLEALEHYAAILMNTSYIIGRAVSLSREQVDEALRIRARLGTRGGGTPGHCADKAANLRDVVHNRPPLGREPARQPNYEED